MLEKEERQWYILWSPTDCKFSVVEQVLLGMDAELWVPCFKQVVGREKEVVPLYPSYYFVKCTEEVRQNIEDRIFGKKAKGKLMFMKTEDKHPHTLSDEEVKRVKQVEEEEVNSAVFDEKDTVRIMGGAFKDCVGTVLEVKKGSVKISVTMFNREFDAMWLPEKDCEKINE